MYLHRIFLLLVLLFSFPLSAQETESQQKQELKSTRQEEFEKELNDDKYLQHRRYFEEQMKNDGEYDTSNFMQQFFKMLFILGLLVGGLLLAAWLFKNFVSSKMEQANVSSAIKILEQRSISQRSAVYLIEVHGHRIVIGESQNGMTLLSDIPMSHTHRSGANFENVLDQENQ